MQGWREVRTLCEAKSAKFGRDFNIISRWEPTSQICSDCGYKWGKLDLSIRSVLCINCGSEHDRDENAAKNINKVGIGHCHDSKRARIDRKYQWCCRRSMLKTAPNRWGNLFAI